MPSMHPARRVCQLLALLVLPFCCLTKVYAQRYPFYNVSIEHGLIQSQVQCMVQDKAGHLWVGTLGGLSRYDGHSFNTYSVRDGLPDNSVQALDADASGTIWIGTKKGLATYDGRKFQQYIFQSQENPQGNIVQTIRNDRAGTTWCIAGRKIYSIHNNKVKSLQLPNGYKEAMSIEIDSSGRLVAAFPGSAYLYFYSPKGWDSLSVLQPQYPCYITRMQADSRKRIWLVTNYGLYIYAQGTVQRAFPNLKVRDGANYIACITEARDKSIWLGTGSGAFRVTDSSIKHYRKANGFTDNRINDILTDAEGNIWMGSDGQGLFRFSGAPFIAIDESTKLPSAQIMALEADWKNNALYMGSYDAGLYYYKDNEISQIHFPGNITPTIVAMATRHNDELWIGTPNGLWSYNKTSKHFTRKEGLPSEYITALYVTPDDKLWIGFGSGAAVYDGHDFRLLPLQDVIVYDFLPLGNDSMLLATGNGIKLFYDQETRSFITGTALDSASPQCLTLQGNQLWAGTSDNGIIAYDLHSGKSIVINKSNGLRSDFVYNIYAAADNSIWAGTGFGIYNIKPAGNQLLVNFYGRGQGVTGMESNHNAILGMPDGTIWFGTTNGAMQYRPGTQRTIAHPVSIVMQSVKLFGERITDSSYYKGTTPHYNVPLNLQLPPTKNNLTFTFQALSLSDEAGILYRYHMEGLDAQWSDWAPTNTITYSALPPGTYSLHVQCSAEGQPIDGELVYPFVIITPFHKTTLFRFLIFGGCILLGVSLQYMANRRKQARLKMIEALRREEQAKVRERTAEDFHDEVGNKLTRITVLTNVLKTRLGEIPPDTKRIIDQINENTVQLYSGTRDILWSLIPSNDSLYEILHRIRDFGGDLFGDTEVAFHFTGTQEQWREYRLPMDASRNLIMIFKEAMNNCLKYSEADTVTLTASLDSGHNELTIQLKDNGKGFDMTTVKRGNGLNNMAIRAKRINGTLAVDAARGQGTTLTLRFKIPRNRG
jgi:ligand-binding sensor domain-containing protein/signal transduction histidine kinase